jgi:hypothetical protein
MTRLAFRRFPAGYRYSRYPGRRAGVLRWVLLVLGLLVCAAAYTYIHGDGGSNTPAKFVILASGTANEPRPGLPGDITQELQSAGQSSTGDRLRQYKDDTGTIPLRGLDPPTNISMGLAASALVILAALMFLRMRTEVSQALGPHSGATATIIGLTVAVVSVLANTLVIAVHALDGSPEAERLHRRRRIPARRVRPDHRRRPRRPPGHRRTERSRQEEEGAIPAHCGIINSARGTTEGWSW